MTPVRKLKRYGLYIKSNEVMYYLAYNHSTQGYYISQYRGNAEKFISKKDALQAYTEFNKKHNNLNILPNYAVVEL